MIAHLAHHPSQVAAVGKELDVQFGLGLPLAIDQREIMTRGMRCGLQPLHLALNPHTVRKHSPQNRLQQRPKLGNRVGGDAVDDLWFDSSSDATWHVHRLRGRYRSAERSTRTNLRRVQAIVRHQFIVRSLFNNASGIDHNNSVGIANG